MYVLCSPLPLPTNHPSTIRDELISIEWNVRNESLMDLDARLKEEFLEVLTK